MHLLKRKNKNVMFTFLKWFVPDNNNVSLYSIVFSFLLTCVSIKIIAPHLYGRNIAYDEFVAGLTTWSAYHKQSDLDIVKIFLIGLIISFFACTAILNIWNRHVKSDYRIRTFFCVGFLAMICSFFANKEIAITMLVMYIILLAFYMILYTGRSSDYKEFVHVSLLALLLQWNITALETVWNVFLEIRFGRLDWLFLVLQLGMLIFSVIYAFMIRMYKGEKENSIFEKKEFLIGLVQLPIPVVFLGFYNFYYQYGETEELIPLFYSPKWKLFCLIVALFMILFSTFLFLKKKYEIYLTTFLSVAAFRVFQTPSGIMNIDFFHNGEITIPTQQLFSYGKLPYFDVVPIHGLCDYFYGMINYLFFDGTFFSVNVATQVGNLLMAMVLAGVIYATIPNRKLAFVIIFLFAPFFSVYAGMRYFVFFLFFFVMFCQKVRSNTIWYIWWWILLSILAIGWNASIGGSVSAAFIPVIIIRSIRDLPNALRELIHEKRSWASKKIALAYGSLLFIGISFIPIFSQIVLYLKENTGTTFFVNGMEMIEDFSNVSSYFVPGLVTEQGSFFIRTFGFLIPFLICLFYAFQKDDKECSVIGKENTVILFLCIAIISNYAFVRYDEGLRTNVISIFLCLLIAFTMLRKCLFVNGRPKYEFAFFIILIFIALFGTDGTLLVFPNQVCEIKKVETSQKITIMGETVEDPLVYVTGDSVGIKRLGNGFISGNALNSLKNINYVLDEVLEDETTYFDLSNQVANYFVFDKEMATKYTSVYNISNDKMQTMAVNQLSKELPSLILLSPDIRFDEVTVSIRSMKLYQYLMAQGYKPYQYENVVYLLLDETKKAEGSSDGTSAFAQIMHKTELHWLPMIWADAKEVNMLTICKPEFVLINQKDGYRIAFKDPSNIKEIMFLELAVGGIEEEPTEESTAEYAEESTEESTEESAEDITATLSFTSNIDGTERQTSFVFNLKTEHEQYLIPVGTSPYWTDTENISEVQIVFSDGVVRSITESEVSFFIEE